MPMVLRRMFMSRTVLCAAHARHRVKAVFGVGRAPDGGVCTKQASSNVGSTMPPNQLDKHWTSDQPRDYDRRMSPAAARESGLRSASSVRAALLAGFAVVFGLWLLWGYQLVRSLRQIEQNVASVHESYVRGEQTLSKIPHQCAARLHLICATR